MASSNVVLIAGATGFLGQQIAEAFLKSGKYEVRILSQASALKDEVKSKKLNELQAKGAKLVEGDIENVESLKKAFQGVHTVVSTISGGGFAHQVNLVTAAKDAGVTRFVPSEYGVDVSKADIALFGPKKAVRAAVESSGLEWTYIITGFFYETTFLPWLGLDVANLKTTIVENGNTQFSVSAVSDFAQIIPDVLSNPKSKNASVNLVGDNLTWNQLVEIYEKKLGKKFERTNVTAASLEAEIKSNPNPFATVSQQLQWVVATGAAKVASQDQSQFSNHKFLTVAEWVAKQ